VSDGKRFLEPLGSRTLGPSVDRLSPLHASVHIHASDDVGRERLCRYLNRPAFSLARLLSRDGRMTEKEVAACDVTPARRGARSLVRAPALQAGLFVEAAGLVLFGDVTPLALAPKHDVVVTHCYDGATRCGYRATIRRALPVGWK
jgi:hypothetical protein